MRSIFIECIYTVERISWNFLFKTTDSPADRAVLPELLTVGVFEVTLLPQSCQDGPAFPLQPDQSAVL